MKAPYLRGWWKCFVSLGLIISFALVNPACLRVRKQDSPRDVPCQTRCGLRLYGSNDCRGLQVAEDRAIEVYSERFSSVCDKFENWNVFVQPSGFEVTGWNSSAHDGGALGLTFCKEKEMQVETDDWPNSSLSHEIVHLLEWCGQVHDSGDDGHASWDGGWQEEAIKRASGL